MYVCMQTCMDWIARMYASGLSLCVILFNVRLDVLCIRVGSSVLLLVPTHL